MNENSEKMDNSSMMATWDEMMKVAQSEDAPEQTLVDATGYPQKENLFSNLLAFYADSSNPHGFGTLIADALLSFADMGVVSCGAASVQREYVTEENNRIDLVIETGAGIVVALEIKLNAKLYNDLGEYRETLEKRFPESRRIYFVLGYRKYMLNDPEWLSITYTELWERVRDKLGHTITFSKLNWLSGLISLIEHTEKMNNTEFTNDERYMLENSWRIMEAIDAYRIVENKVIKWYFKLKEMVAEGTSQGTHTVPISSWTYKVAGRLVCQVFEFETVHCAVDFAIHGGAISFSFFHRDNMGSYGSEHYQYVCDCLRKHIEGKEPLNVPQNKRMYLIYEELNEATLASEHLDEVLNEAFDWLMKIQAHFEGYLKNMKQ